ncbi:DUF2958 domain-containing protein [Streptomyces sp. NPDC048442]|uniref:DUF2958 domain-containing protein n=1 Tax=Streptomyces sp. NPDC048442 TaxID=3154823 RepID=UPI00343AFFE6
MVLPAEKNRARRGHDFYPPESVLASIPALYASEDVSLAEKVLHAHYFVGGCDWYVAELDPESGLAFGWVHITDGEWGMFSLPEVEEVRVHGLFVAERDLSFEPAPAEEIDRIPSHGY